MFKGRVKLDLLPDPFEIFLALTLGVREKRDPEGVNRILNFLDQIKRVAEGEEA